MRGWSEQIEIAVLSFTRNGKPRLVLLQEPKEAGTAEPSFPPRRKEPSSTTASSSHHHSTVALLQYICDNKLAMCDLCRQLIAIFGAALQCCNVRRNHVRLHDPSATNVHPTRDLWPGKEP
jgi:hypothetical protein